MAIVTPEQIAEARAYIERLRANPRPGTGMRREEVALMAAADMIDELVDACRRSARVLAALADSKKIALTDEQRAALKDPYGRCLAAIANAGGQP